MKLKPLSRPQSINGADTGRLIPKYSRGCSYPAARMLRGPLSFFPRGAIHVQKPERKHFFHKACSVLFFLLKRNVSILAEFMLLHKGGGLAPPLKKINVQRNRRQLHGCKAPSEKREKENPPPEATCSFAAFATPAMYVCACVNAWALHMYFTPPTRLPAPVGVHQLVL